MNAQRLLSACCLLMVLASCDCPGTSPAVLTVERTAPIEGGSGVAIDMQVQITFSEVMVGDAGTVTLDGDPILPTERAWNAAGTRLTLLRALPANADITVRVETDVQALSGARLDAPFELHFRTGWFCIQDASGPAPRYLDDLVVEDGDPMQVRIPLTEPLMDPLAGGIALVPPATLTSAVMDGSDLVLAWSDLPVNTRHVLLLGAPLTDACGNPMPAVSFVLLSRPDRVAPTAAITAPGTTCVSPFSTGITVIFSEPMAAGAIVSLTPGTRTVVLAQGDTVASFTGLSMAYGDTWTVTIANGRDLSITPNALSTAVLKLTTLPSSVPPSLTSFLPDGSTIIAPSTPIQLSFSRAMDSTTGTLAVSGNAGDLTSRLNAPTWSTNGRVVTWTWSTPPDPVIDAQVFVTATGFAGLCGLVATVAPWNYSLDPAVDTSAPTATLVDPATTTCVDHTLSSVTVNFSEPMAPVGTVSLHDSGGLLSSAPITAGALSTTLLVGLGPATDYTVQIDPSAHDQSVAANPIAPPTSFAFRTADLPVTTIAVSPASGAVVPIGTSKVWIQFDRPMKVTEGLIHVEGSISGAWSDFTPGMIFWDSAFFLNAKPTVTLSPAPVHGEVLTITASGFMGEFQVCASPSQTWTATVIDPCLASTTVTVSSTSPVVVDEAGTAFGWATCTVDPRLHGVAGPYEIGIPQVFTVPTTGNWICDVNLTLTIGTVGDVGDEPMIHVELTHPNGVTNCNLICAGVSASRTINFDELGTSLVDMSTPDGDTVKPSQSLDVFNGRSPSGTWYLWVGDGRIRCPSGAGCSQPWDWRLESWSVTFTVGNL